MGARKSKNSKAEKEQQRVGEICSRLDDEYPDVNCALYHQNPYQLLVATILSAQCTDVRVNMVTPALFERYPSPKVLAGAEAGELQELIRSTGFFRNKAKNLMGAAKKMVASFKGKVPESMEELLSLPGVAWRTRYRWSSPSFATTSISPCLTARSSDRVAAASGYSATCTMAYCTPSARSRATATADGNMPTTSAIA